MRTRKSLMFLGGLFVAAGLCLAQGQLPRLRVSDNGRYLVKQDGSPFFYLADTAWGLFHFNRQDVDLYLKTRAAQRFTAIQAIVAHYGGLDSPNAYGETVFVNKDPAHPNEAYFQQVDYVVNEAESLGLYVALVPLWCKEYVNEKGSILTKETAFSYGKFLGSRYRNKPVLFILGGDWYPDKVEDLMRAMAAGITEGDGGAHLKTYHPTGIQSSSTWFHNDAWLDFNMVQSRHIILNRTYDLITADWDRTPPKPVVEGESVYEGIQDDLVYSDPNAKRIQPEDVRRAAYCSQFAGAAGYAYGSDGVWQYRGISGARGTRPASGTMNWKDALQRPAGTQMQYLRALLESRPMLIRIPDEWLLVSDPLSTVDRIQACRGSDGSYLFVYTSSGKPVRIRMRDKIHDKLTGKVARAYWYDPRKSTSTLIGDFPKTEPGDRPADVRRLDITREFTPPSSGPGNDWVLVVDDASKNYPAPGKLTH
jgi:hypothetical protein